jgi:hypothetical protein
MHDYHVVTWRADVSKIILLQIRLDAFLYGLKKIDAYGVWKINELIILW